MPLAPFPHAQPDFMCAQKGAGQIDIYDLLPIVERNGVDWGAVEDGGIIDQHVDPTEAFDGLLDHIFNVRFFSDIGL